MLEFLMGCALLSLLQLCLLEALPGYRYNYLSVLRILLKCLNSAVEVFLFAFCDEASFPALLTRHLLGPNVLVQQNSTIFACIAVRWTSYARVNWLTVFREH